MNPLPATVIRSGDNKCLRVAQHVSVVLMDTWGLPVMCGCVPLDPPPPRDALEGGDAPPPTPALMPDYLWFAFVCFLIRSHPPPRLQGAQPTPSHCPPDAKCRLQSHLQPTVTAPTCLTACGGASQVPSPSNAPPPPPPPLQAQMRAVSSHRHGHGPPSAVLSRSHYTVTPKRNNRLVVLRSPGPPRHWGLKSV